MSIFVFYWTRLQNIFMAGSIIRMTARSYMICCRGRTSCPTFAKRKFEICWSRVWPRLYFCLTVMVERLLRWYTSVPFTEIWVRQWTRLWCGHCFPQLSAAANLSYPAGSSDWRRPQFLRSVYPQMGAAAAPLRGLASR